MLELLEPEGSLGPEEEQSRKFSFPSGPTLVIETGRVGQETVLEASSPFPELSLSQVKNGTAKFMVTVLRYFT